MPHEILVVGSGAREHAMVLAALKSPLVSKVRCLKGNAGIAEIADCLPTEPDDIPAIINIAKSTNSTIIVGPEKPLALGLVDAANEEKIRIYGPTRAAAKIEWSKVYAKHLMREAGILTAEFDTFTLFGRKQAHTFVDRMDLPVVVKGDGLALGKGVIIAKTYEEAHATVDELLKKHRAIVIEKSLEGNEFSLMALCFGTNYTPLITSADTKPLYPGGPNTGGIGVYAPLTYLKTRQVEQYYEETIGKMLHEMKKRGLKYQGTSYPNLMKTQRGTEVLEFNARFGDPELPALVRLLESDLIEALELTIDGKIKDIKFRWSPQYVVNVVLASQGYPDNSPDLGHPITGIVEANKLPGTLVFHAGTTKKGEQFYNSGGRVLDVTAIGDTPKQAQERAYAAVDVINFQGKTYNPTIGDQNIAT